MKNKSQKLAILGWLSSGKKLTPLEALSKFGCFRLGARIWELKDVGHNITSKLVDRNGKKVAEYQLVKP